MRYHLTLVKMTTAKKGKTNAGEDVEKRQFISYPWKDKLDIIGNNTEIPLKI